MNLATGTRNLVCVLGVVGERDHTAFDLIFDKCERPFVRKILMAFVCFECPHPLPNVFQLSRNP